MPTLNVQDIYGSSIYTEQEGGGRKRSHWEPLDHAAGLEGRRFD